MKSSVHNCFVLHADKRHIEETREEFVVKHNASGVVDSEEEVVEVNEILNLRKVSSHWRGGVSFVSPSSVDAFCLVILLIKNSFNFKKRIYQREVPKGAATPLHEQDPFTELPGQDLRTTS